MALPRCGDGLLSSVGGGGVGQGIVVLGWAGGGWGRGALLGGGGSVLVLGGHDGGSCDGGIPDQLQRAAQTQCVISIMCWILWGEKNSLRFVTMDALAQ